MYGIACSVYTDLQRIVLWHMHLLLCWVLWIFLPPRQYFFLECCEIKKWLQFIRINCLLTFVFNVKRFSLFTKRLFTGIHYLSYLVWRACIWTCPSRFSNLYRTHNNSNNMLHFTSKSMRFHLTTSWMHTIVILIVVFILNTGKLAKFPFSQNYDNSNNQRW